jgi:hypothetical protein
MVFAKKSSVKKSSKKKSSEKKSSKKSSEKKSSKKSLAKNSGVEGVINKRCKNSRGKAGVASSAKGKSLGMFFCNVMKVF